MKWNGHFVDNDRNRTFLFALLLAFYFLSVLIHLEYYPLNGEEPRRAIIAIEMRHSGNYIMPTSLGWEYYNKPPIYNWLISASMFLTGTESEIPVRLPSLVFIMLWAACNYLILKKFISREIAALSSLFLLTSFDILFWGMNNGGEIDIFYSFLVYMQVISLFYFNYTKNWIALYTVSYFFCAIGFLTKGFPSILFQGLTLLALCYYNRSLLLLFRWQHLAGLAIFTIGAGSYFYAYSFQGSPVRLLTNLLKESFNKSALGDHPERMARKILDYPFSFLKILLPWSLLLLLLLKRWRFPFWSHPFVRFSILFILFNVPVYWFTGHPKMRYSYVFIPFSMTILAFIFYEFKHLYPQLIRKVFNWMIVVFIVALLFIVFSPLILNVNLAWLILVIAILLAYLYLYRKALLPQVWFFGLGIVLLRFIYASLYLPGMYQQMDLRYDREMARLAEINKFQPVSIYCKPDTLDLSIDLKVARFHYDSIPAIPFLAYQIPYYYYRSSGKLVTYDTALRANTNYIGFRSSLGDLNTEILYAYKDLNHNGDSVVLFRLLP
jgi:hypothetical protein